jgi:hypothetical protein
MAPNVSVGATHNFTYPVLDTLHSRGYYCKKITVRIKEVQDGP